jgi:HlyD family secretion protein
MEPIKSFFRSKAKVSILIVILTVAGYFIYKHYSAQAAPTRYVLGKVRKQTIVTSISGSGQVSQDRSVDITPTSAGKLTSVNVKQGDKVKAGQTIAIVDETNNSLALSQARASLASAQASYDQTLAGATNSDLELSQLSVDSAQQELDTAKTNLQTITKQQAQAVSTAQTNLYNGGLQAIPTPNNIGSATITLSGTYTGMQPGNYKISVYIYNNTGAGQQFSITGAETDTEAINKLSPSPLGTSGLYIQLSGTAYNNDTWNITIPNTTATVYNSNYIAYQNALINQTSAIATAQNQITLAQNNLKQVQINSNQKKAPPTDQALASAKAQLLSAQTNLESAGINYNNNILKAPFDGIVAKLNYLVRDQISGSTVVATVITNQSIAIIPLNEVDVAKVKVGDKATMAFDAIDGLAITGTIAQIDQLGTVSQGVVNYNVKITFDVEDPRIKPGMSVSVAIITGTQADTLSVPSSAIKTQSNNTYVLVLDPNKTQSTGGVTGVTSTAAPTQVSVQTGATDGTSVQILNGLNEDDNIVVQTIAPAKTTTTATPAVSIPGLGGGGGGFGGGGRGGATTRPGG